MYIYARFTTYYRVYNESLMFSSNIIFVYPVIYFFTKYLLLVCTWCPETKGTRGKLVNLDHIWSKFCGIRVNRIQVRIFTKIISVVMELLLDVCCLLNKMRLPTVINPLFAEKNCKKWKEKKWKKLFWVLYGRFTRFPLVPLVFAPDNNDRINLCPIIGVIAGKPTSIFFLCRCLMRKPHLHNIYSNLFIFFSN